MTTPADIEAMIAQVALRDRSAFSALYDATSAKLFGVCLRVLNNRAEAEDVLQEVYIRVWHKADSYTVTGHSPMTWLITVARNLSIDRLRKRKALTKPIDDAVELGLIAVEHGSGSPSDDGTTCRRWSSCPWTASRVSGRRT